MTLTADLQKFHDEPLKVLDDGHVQLIDVMGDDMSIVHAARVSYGAGTKRVSEDRHLIRYLMRHRHSTPFEMCEIKLRVRVPMDTWRQWIRHRMASVNEYSTRYSEAIDSAQRTTPDAWRAQATTNKQGSAGLVTEFPDHYMGQLRMSGLSGLRENPDFTPGDYLTAREQHGQAVLRDIYEERIQFGVAREQARKDLPLSTYTEAYWKIDLHNLLHFLALRMDSHAQWEIRQYANAIAEIVKVWLPWTWEAFEDYRLKGLTLSRMEVAALSEILRTVTEQLPGWSAEGVIDTALKAASAAGMSITTASGAKTREAQELEAKMGALIFRFV